MIKMIKDMPRWFWIFAAVWGLVCSVSSIVVFCTIVDQISK